MESQVRFNIYLDFVARRAEHEVLQKYPNTGLQYSYLIPALPVNNVEYMALTVKHALE